jgi:hypothetical protein
VLYRPVIPVRFHGPQGSTKVRALLDTGADESYITETIAADLGVTPVSNQPATIHSASGKLSVWYGSVVVEVSDEADLFSFPLIVGVVSEEWDELILGHLGFLQYFDVTCSYADKCVTLTARSS